MHQHPKAEHYADESDSFQQSETQQHHPRPDGVGYTAINVIVY
jgi:hypothetical protein